MKLRLVRTFDRDFHVKSRKKRKNKIRLANCKIHGVLTPSVRGADKNHNPRKGTETVIVAIFFVGVFGVRTTIPVRGRIRKADIGHRVVMSYIGFFLCSEDFNRQSGDDIFHGNVSFRWRRSAVVDPAVLLLSGLKFLRGAPSR